MLTAALAAIVVVVRGAGDGVTVVHEAAAVAGEAIHVPCEVSGPACGAALQATLDQAPAGTTITLDAGKVYEASLVVQPRRGAGDDRMLTITTHGWKAKGAGWDGLVTPVDRPRLAVIRGAPRSTAALAIVDGEAAGFVTLRGLAFAATPPAGQGDLIRIGSGESDDPAKLPRRVVLEQLLIQGDRDYGQRRGIAANGADVSIAQIWCEEVFNPSQDSQCIGAWNGSHRVRVRHAYLAAASENIMIGGAPIAKAAMQPSDWVIEDVVLHKPLRWRDDGRNRQVKNLLEFKHGRNLTVRRVLAVNNWRAAQDGRGLLLHYTTNGRCPECGNLEQVVIEDFVMLNVDAGISLQGYSWQADSFSDGKLRDVTLRNLFVHVSGSGRAIQISNVSGPHDISIERSTFINHGSSWLMASFGRSWRDDVSVGDGGAMEGLRVVDNVFAANGEYGVTAPDGHHFGSRLAEFVAARLQISGNVIGDVPAPHLTNYNRHRAGGEANRGVERSALLKRLSGDACGEWVPDKGAACARLQPIFGWRRLLPEP
jgi:hypothetical protein